MDECPTEDQQAGETGRTERVSVASRDWQRPGLAYKVMASSKKPFLPASSCYCGVGFWGKVAQKSISLLGALPESIWSSSTKRLQPEGGERAGYISAKAALLLWTRCGQGAFLQVSLGETSLEDLC